ncbi:MAG: hypothetical protein H3C38_10720 [Rhodospirillales bacterium]|nr:hypothetical protein [Rhodospirillales bacterium]
MKRITGIVTIVQESRFRLDPTPQRAPMLFLLSPDAPVEPQDLPALAETRRRVEVHYTEDASLIAAIAHDIRELPGRPG